MENRNLNNAKSVDYTISTRFMESYRKVSKIELGTLSKSVTRSDGAMEFYMLRTDNYIERFYPDTSSESGFSSQKLTLSGGNFDVVVDSSGSTIVFASSLEKLCYIKETTPCSGEFGSPSTIKIDNPDNSLTIANTFVRVYDNQIWIAVLMETDITAKTGSRALLYGKWNNDYTHLTNSGFTVSGTNGAWYKQDGAAPYVVVSGNSIVGVNGLNNEVKHIPATPSSINHIASVYDSVAQNDILYALAHDGSCYYSFNSKCSNTWDKHLLKETVSKLILESDTIGNIWVNGLTDGGNLYHGSFPINEEVDDNLFLIKSGVKNIATNYNIGGSPSIVCINDQGISLDLLLYENCSGMWNEQVIPISCDDIYTAPAYCSEIALLDKDKAPTPMLDIWVWSSEYARVVINENVIILDNKKVKLQADVLGKIYIHQLTDSLSAPNIFISTTEEGTQDTTFVLNHYEVARDKLSNLSADNLNNAIKQDGSYLLNEKYRTPEITNSLAEALKHCVKLIPNNGANNGVLYRSNLLGANSLLNAGQLVFAENSEDCHWSFSVLPDGGGEFKTHSFEEVTMLMSEMNSIGSLKKFFKHIGSFVKAVAKKVVKVAKVVVSKVKNVVTTVIQYVEDGVCKLFQHIVETAQEVFAMAETIFHQVEVTFKDLFHWIGFIFNWDDILRSKEALNHITNEFFTLTTDLTKIIATYITSKIDGLDKVIKEAIDSLIKKLGSTASIDSYMKSNSSAQMTTEHKDAISHNFLLNQLLHSNTTPVSIQVNECSAFAITLNNDNQTAYNLFIEKIERLAQDTIVNDEFNKALEYFKNMLSNSNNIMNYALCGILELAKGLVHILLEGLEIIVEGALSLVEESIKLIQNIVNAEINIPFISQLYKKISGNNLSLKDASSLILSIPFTILYKVIKKTAPFKDEAELNEFKQSFTASYIINSVSGSLNNTNSNSLKDKLCTVSEVVSIASVVIYYSCTAYLDLKDSLVDDSRIYPEDIDNENISPSKTSILALGGVALISEIVWDAASGYLLANSSKRKLCDEINFLFVALGCTLDIFSLYKKGRLSDNASFNLQLVTFFYGIGVLISGGCTALSLDLSKTADKISYSATLIPAINIISKVGLMKPIIEATEECSLIAVTVLDGIVGTSEAALLLYPLIVEEEEEENNQITYLST